MDNQPSIDVNTAGASSTPALPTQESVAQTQPAAPSVATQSESPTQGESLESTLKAGFQQMVKEGKVEPLTTEEGQEAGELQQLKPTEEQQTEAVQEKEGEQEQSRTEEEKSVNDENEDKGPIPYDRFQSVVRERQELKTKVETLEPMAQAHQKLLDYCQGHNITNEDYVQAMELAALLKSDPVQFAERMKPLLESVGTLTGDNLPADLAQEVEDGFISRERAKELAQLRARDTHRTKVSQLTEQQRAQQAQQQFVQSITDAWSNWDAAKRKADPDFKPGTNGLWELVNDRLTALAQARNPDGSPANPIRSPAEATALVEKAYSFVMGTKKKLTPAGTSRKVLSSSASSQTKAKTALDQTTFEDALRVRAQELGALPK